MALRRFFEEKHLDLNKSQTIILLSKASDFPNPETIWFQLHSQRQCVRETESSRKDGQHWEMADRREGRSVPKCFSLTGGALRGIGDAWVIGGSTAIPMEFGRSIIALVVCPCRDIYNKWTG